MKKIFSIYPDKESDILWIVFKKGPSDYYEEMAPGINVEFDEKNNIIGVEILHYSKLLTDQQFRSKKSKVYYEPEDNILTIRLLEDKLDDSDQVENIIVSLNKQNQPIDIEILDASKIFASSKKTKAEKTGEITNKIATPVAHRIK